MERLHDILGYVQLVLYVGLGLIAFMQWRKRGGKPAAWVAATFAALASVVVISQFLPEDDVSGTVDVVQRFVIAILVLFPYFLFRFMASFESPGKVLHVVAALLTGATVVATFLLDHFPEPNEQRTDAFQAYIYLLLGQWVVLLGAVTFRLWHAGRGQPVVARRRMRTMSIGSAGLAITLVIAGTASASEDVTGVQIATSLLALATGPFFLLGFAPPAFVRNAWRQQGSSRLQEAEFALMEALSPSDITDVLLPEVTELAAGRGSLVIDRGGLITGVHGLTAPEAARLASQFKNGGADGVTRDAGTITVPMRSGKLVVVTSPYTPFFGQEEMDELRRLALLADLALARTEHSRRERELTDQLLEAQRLARIGSWEWDIPIDRVTWSDQMYRMLGYEPGEVEATGELYNEHVHPDDREVVAAKSQETANGNTAMDYEHRMVRRDGTPLVIHVRGRISATEDGQPIRMIGTVQDVTEQREQEALRERFIANAAHELRTPLTSLLGFVEMLSRARHRLDEAKLQTMFDAMTRSGDRLAVLIENLLDLSKLQAGQVQVDIEPVSIDTLAHEVVASTPPPDGRRVEVEVTDTPVALADKHRLDQVVTNLLTNAYRYGGPNISLSGARRNGDVILSVTDDGPGVEDQLVGELFQPFSRGSTSSTIGGSGLGLAIVKMLVEACGGEIWHEALQPTGARFCVKLKSAE
ncbi:MAG TPA: PAS domain-containing sensor histidine kinase [Actinomycetota bacterium]|nr:PAS domain-containing sensor histidine kinase [Actinomycetota bacterium]